jgi:propionyl-CoA carboxylase beta chain
VLARIVDGGRLLELSRHWAPNIVVGLARVQGMPCGVVANQPRVLGGCLDAEASAKAAWFVDFCDRFGLPLCVFVDTPGFLPSRAQESSGVLRQGADLLRAFASATVPRVTVTLRQAYGGAHIAMSCSQLGNGVAFAWPGAVIGVMGASQAVEVIYRRELLNGADRGTLIEGYAREALGGEALNMAVHEVIQPDETRSRIAEVLR